MSPRGLLVGTLVVCACAGRHEAEPDALAGATRSDAPATIERLPFGPTHSGTGDVYEIAASPQVNDGVLRVPVVGSENCGPRSFQLHTLGVTTREPATVATALVLDAGGTRCDTEGVEILEFPLAETLGPGCYDTMFLTVPGQEPIAFSLDGLGCPAEVVADEPKRKKKHTDDGPLVASALVYDRWGDPYALDGDPMLEDGRLVVRTRYHGGCSAHAWDVSLREADKGKRLSTLTVDLVHESNDDSCRRLEREWISVDVAPWFAGGECPDLLELHVPGQLPTGESYDRDYLIAVDPERDCGATPVVARKSAGAPEKEEAPDENGVKTSR